MTDRLITGILAAAVLTAAPYASAQAATEKKEAKPAAKPAAPAAQGPKAPAEMSQLKAFDGSWQCKGEMAPGPGQPPVKSTSSVKSHADLGGFWQVGTVKGAMPGMPPFEGRFHMTYDGGSKQFVMVWLDNMGGWAQQTAPGWDGDKIVFTGEGVMGGQKMTGRDTFAKKSDGTLVHTAEMQKDGNWTSMGEETCHKAAAKAPAAKKE